MEIKDSDDAASQVRIDIEKTGPSELHTDGVTVNHTLFDVGHGAVFVLQLVCIRLMLSAAVSLSLYGVRRTVVNSRCFLVILCPNLPTATSNFDMPSTLWEERSVSFDF